MRIYLARHGESATPRRLLGASNPGLSADGLAQSHDLAASLDGIPIEKVFSSALRRASESAAIVAARCTAPQVVDARINEIGYGAWDGLEWNEIERTDPDLARRKIEDWWGVTPPGGEPAEQFATRLVSFWSDLTASPLPAVAIVAHSAVNSCLASLARYGRIDWDAALSFRQEHGERLEIDTSTARPVA